MRRASNGVSKFGKKIAFSIISGGLFVIVSFAAIEYQNLSFTFYNIVGFLIAFIFLFGVAMGQNFAAPVKEILDQADSVSKGDSHKFNLKSKTRDEIEELAMVFEKITQDFQKTKEEVETIKKTAEIKFKTKTLLSEQVIKALEEKIKNRTLDLEKVAKDLEILQNESVAKNGEANRLRSKRRKSSKQWF